MADIMYPIPFGQLMDWILTEYRTQGRIFGVQPIMPQKSIPCGPAAGPHTQLAQNIITAFIAGARFFELKTVQIMDGSELRACVSKPCISAIDECYNCEWSTELTAAQACGEYIKAWFACKLLAKELDLCDPDGFLFNMSVGYDLAGIQSDKIDCFIETMKDASRTAVWQECTGWALENLDRFYIIDAGYIASISPQVSDSVTESTLHGCPPQEIERIAAYLLAEKGLHTYIKCNPTLLGYDLTRKLLDQLGFDQILFDQHHFQNDLQYEDALPMFRRLSELSRKNGLRFGLKLTNTFPVKGDGQLPAQEMYMSGRSLYPLALTLAQRLAADLDGKIPISFSGGADAHNIRGLLEAGIRPVTMATTLLKPGGYAQLTKIVQAAASAPMPETVDAAALAQNLTDALQDAHYRKSLKPQPSRKVGLPLPLTDCFTAPCRSGCPIGQDIPAYLQAVNEEDYEKALRIILERNPLPFTTGTICPHHCTDKCMGSHRLSPVAIRSAKLQAARGGFETVLASIKPAINSGKRVAIIGGGPAGLAAAAFLTRSGVAATIFERTDRLGGIARHVIPEFRLESSMIDRDIRLCLAYGAEVQLNTHISDFRALWNEGFTDMIVAAGAWVGSPSPLEYGDAMNVIDFLGQAKAAPEALSLGKNIVIIGGGNTAMDAARTAKRLQPDACVRLLYRRTRRYMPADEEELSLALQEGVEFLELLSPIGARDGQLLCRVMKLGPPDADGRSSSIPTDAVKRILADSIIYAVGEQVDGTLFERCGAVLTRRGLPVTDHACRTTAAHIFAIGDARRGPATVVEAIADAAAASAAIAGCTFDQFSDANSCAPGGSCRGCAGKCEVCAEVCPNRANVPIGVPGHGTQILHLDGMCNECGNCAVFCPYEGRPYRDKFTLYWSRWDFENSKNPGFFPLSKDRVLLRFDGKTSEVDIRSGDGVIMEMIRIVMAQYPYLLTFEEQHA